MAKFSLSSPEDTGGLAAVLDQEHIPAEAVVAVLVKTDGTGELNDYSRHVAEAELAAFFAARLGVSPEEVRRRVLLIASSGCEGLVVPHGYVVYRTGGPADRTSVPADRRRGLAVGMASTRPLRVEEIGTVTQAYLVAEAVREACAKAGVTSRQDVGVVFLKGPVLKPHQAGRSSVSPRVSIRQTRAACALGAALALGEVDARAITPEAIGVRHELYSGVAFAFSGNELDTCRVLVLGNAPGGDPNYRIRSTALRHPADWRAIAELLSPEVGWQPGAGCPSLVGLFAKAGLEGGGEIGGRPLRLGAPDLDPGRQLRAALSGMLVAAVQDPEVFVSAGAEHQGPPGGGLAAAVFRDTGGGEASSW